MLVFQGKQLEKSKNLSKIASMVAETIYSMSPKILNETINKDKPTGSGRLALRKLLYAIVQHPLNEIDGYSYNNENANLGITGQPAELSLYLSLIKSEGIHKYNKKLGIYVFDKQKAKICKACGKPLRIF